MRPWCCRSASRPPTVWSRNGVRARFRSSWPAAWPPGWGGGLVPFGAIARGHGRRAAFLVGTGAGVLTGLLAMLALIMGWFWLFCLATFFGGGYAAVVLSFRFAAADGVEPKRRARALSLVMAGGVAAGVVGPQLVTWTMHLWLPHMFAATRSEEHTSELQSLMRISYAVFCLKKKNIPK